MKTIKQISMTVSFCLTSYVAFSQPPTGSPPSPSTVPNNANSAWYRGGNALVNGPNNIFGTMWNSPIYTYTNGINRARLNGTLTAPLSGVNQNVSGFMGLKI